MHICEKYFFTGTCRIIILFVILDGIGNRNHYKIYNDDKKTPAMKAGVFVIYIVGM